MTATVTFADGYSFHPGDFKSLSWTHQRQHRIAERDGWSCAYCGTSLACNCNPGQADDPWGSVPATVDHRVAQANGGSHSLNNLVLACRKCNSSKHKKALELSPVWHAPSDMNIRSRAYDWIDWFQSWLPTNDGPPVPAQTVNKILNQLAAIVSGSEYPPDPHPPEEEDEEIGDE